MPKYKIKISYRTGNSFGSHDEEEFIDLEWEKLEVVKENLQFIKEHYKQYKELNGWNRVKTSEQIFKENKDKEWFVSQKRKNGESYIEESCIKFKADDEIFMQIYCFWCGYFESLQSAEIIIDVPEENDMKIEF